MKKIEYTCDKCGSPIDGKTLPFDYPKNGFVGVGDTSLITLERTDNNGYGNNQIPMNGWHFHSYCADSIFTSIRSHLKP